MATLLELTVVGLCILLVMKIAWPFFKKGAVSDEDLAERWKTLWQIGLISWIGGVVLVFVVGNLRQEFEAIQRNNEITMKQIRAEYLRQN